MGGEVHERAQPGWRCDPDAAIGCMRRRRVRWWAGHGVPHSSSRTPSVLQGGSFGRWGYQMQVPRAAVAPLLLGSILLRGQAGLLGRWAQYRMSLLWPRLLCEHSLSLVRVQVVGLGSHGNTSGPARHMPPRNLVFSHSYPFALKGGVDATAGARAQQYLLV